MSKITLDVSDENVKSVLNILENLKEGLVLDIRVENSTCKKATTYKPKTKEIIKENEPTTGKYMDAKAFKQRLRKK